jgi:hypothetical protein
MRRRKRADPVTAAEGDAVETFGSGDLPFLPAELAMWSAEAADPGRSPETHAAVIGKILFFMGLPAEPGSGALLMPKNRLKARGRAVPL